MLKIRLLQTPVIELDGEAVFLPFKRAEALLYYLAVKRTASRQELIALLWESDDEAKGLKNLRNALYTIKKALGGDVLLSPQKATISLNPEWEIDCDYDRFTQNRDLTAYQGPFLSGFSVRSAFALDEWISRMREKLHSAYLRELEEQTRSAWQKRRYDEAAGLARAYLAEDPYDETMAVLLMRCLRELQQFARAVQVYQHQKELLSREMGVDPLENTTMLYYEILNQWNAAAKPPAELTAPVGREAIYDSLRAAAFTFAESASRRCSQLLIGETGSGKSELINHFLRTGEFSMLLTLRFECMPSDGQQPLTLWSRILRSLVEFAAAEGISLPTQALERIGHSVAVLPGSSRVQRQLPYDQSLEDSVLLLFSLVSRRKRVLLVLEDLQWIDLQSMQLLSAVLRHLERGALMLLLSSTWGNSPAIGSILEELEADELLHRQVLDPLSAADTAAIIKKELGSTVDDALTERFYQQSGGNRKLLTVLIQAYRQNTDPEQSGKAMDELLLKRLGTLSEDAIQVVQVLSLFRGGIPSHFLLLLTDIKEQAMDQVILDLRRRGIAEEFIYHSISCCRFIHSRMQQLVHSRLTAYQRKTLNGRVAAMLDAREDNNDELTCREIAYHYNQAGNRCSALRHRLRALNLETIRRCESFCASDQPGLRQRTPQELEADAAECQRQLLALQKTEAEAPVLQEMEEHLLLIRGRLALFCGDLDAGQRYLGEFSRSSQHRSGLFPAQVCELLATAAYYRQSTELAERYVTTGLRYLTRSPDPIRQARLYRLRGCCFGLHGDYDRACYYLQEAAETLERHLPDPVARATLAAVCGDLGRCARCRNDFLHAGKWFKKAMTLLQDTGCAGQVWLYVHYARTLFAVDDQLQARQLFEDGLALARQTGELWGRTSAAAYCAFFRMIDGDHQGSAAMLQEALTFAEQAQSPLESGIVNFVCMKIRRRLDLEQRPGSPLQQLLPESADEYARQGVRLCSGLRDVFEMQMLSKDLRDGISTQLRYRSSELYSKNKRFMSE